MKPERSIPRVCDPRPFFGSDACDDRICPLPIRLENCGFSLSQIEPVFASRTMMDRWRTMIVLFEVLHRA